MGPPCPGELGGRGAPGRVWGEAEVPRTGLAGGPEQKCSVLGLSLPCSPRARPCAGGGEGRRCAPPIGTRSQRAAPLFAGEGETPFFLHCAP